MTAPRNWPRLVGYLAGVLLLLLVLQYLLGLWSNVYAPAQFASFDSGGNYTPALNAHITNGDVLFVLSLVALAFAIIARRSRIIVPAAALVVSIAVAGEFGMAFVNSSPNDPVYSFGMGTMFLAALFSAAALMMLARTARPAVRSGTAPTTPGPQPG